MKEQHAATPDPQLFVRLIMEHERIAARPRGRMLVGGQSREATHLPQPGVSLLTWRTGTLRVVW